MASRRTATIVVALGASVAVIVGGVAASAAHHSPTRSAASSADTFTVVEHGKTDVYVYVHPKNKKDVIGNTIGWGNNLFNAKDTKKVGRDEGLCYRTNPGKSWECTWTNILEKGQITVQGPFLDSGKDSKLAITGGTGKYKNARGYMLLHAANKAGTKYDYEFHIS